MGDIRQPTPVLLITSAFSRHGAALEWAAQRTMQGWGPIALVSPQFDFVETDYYEPTMGPGLKKIFFAYENLLAPGDLPQIKIEANQWEID